ncbi:hypothetical protein P0L94_15125 [Microbacter sp. GSS18]|nr:hypothetical protein P0L94_15125 [Microbacter sp. GSS18]
MTTVTHTSHVHVDAPVERVFAHVKMPENFYAAMNGTFRAGDAGHITKMEMAQDDGVGSVYEWESRVMMIPFHATTTREEFVPDEKIVDHTSTGVTWICTLEPEDGGTKLVQTAEVSSKVPGWARLEDLMAWKGDEDLAKMLAFYKEAIEA